MAKPKQTKLNNALVRYHSKGNFEKIKETIELGADIHHQADFLFMSAVYSNNYDLLYYLINRGVDVNTHGGIALTMSSLNGHLESVKFLFERDVNIHKNYKNALVSAIDKEHIDVVKFFLDKKFDINFDGGLPLMRAVSTNNLSIIKILVEAGAKVTHKTLISSIETSKSLVDNYETFKYLAKNGGDVSANNQSCLKWAYSYNSIPLVKFLIAECNEDPSVILEFNDKNDITDWIKKYEETKLFTEILTLELDTPRIKNKTKLKI